MEMVNVGIFWVIKGKIFSKSQEKAIEEEREKERVKITNKIDSDFEHYVEWDNLCAKFYPFADFATYPRGRILFDTIKRKNIVFIDKCIGKSELALIEKAFDLNQGDYEIAYDKHYSCDKCVNRKNLF
ncbi:hypothetical protein [Chryseobacterium sp.]|uniref:hypothetical protein n=1 Tax=Chryseobacterium sp. TaxID=1871047 RepID=UPI002FC983D7